jgi:hypothetical protein
MTSARGRSGLRSNFGARSDGLYSVCSGQNLSVLSYCVNRQCAAIVLQGKEAGVIIQVMDPTVEDSKAYTVIKYH